MISEENFMMTLSKEQRNISKPGTITLIVDGPVRCFVDDKMVKVKLNETDKNMKNI